MIICFLQEGGWLHNALPQQQRKFRERDRAQLSSQSSNESKSKEAKSPPRCIPAPGFLRALFHPGLRGSFDLRTSNQPKQPNQCLRAWCGVESNPMTAAHKCCCLGLPGSSPEPVLPCALQAEGGSDPITLPHAPKEQGEV